MDVLLQHGINPITLVSAEQVAYYWTQSHIDHYSLEEAKQAFMNKFKIPTDVAINKTIEQIYKTARL
jgi:hypothetical protein